jgi:hypothetical protein
MTSSGTGQSSSVDVIHSLWRMSNSPCRIVPLLASCHRNDGVPFSLALSPPPISVRQGERRYPGRWAEIAPLFAACEDGCQQTINRRPDVPSHREAQNARLLEGPC